MKKSLFWFSILTCLSFTSACGVVSRADSGTYNDTTTESLYSKTLDNSQPISDVYEPLEITEILIRQEIGHDDWELTELEIDKDITINNSSDYDKPVGNMRVVWVTGYVKNKDSSLNADLELYKLEGDNVWYIGKHWGILKSIVTPEPPIVDESNYELSEDVELFQSDINTEESEDSIVESEEKYTETDEQFIELEDHFLSVLNEHFEIGGLFQYLEDGEIFVKDTGMKQVQNHREYSFDLKGVLTNEFNDLSLVDQYELLSASSYGIAEFYEGNMFLLGNIELTIGSDLYIVESSSYILKNEELFLPY